MKFKSLTAVAVSAVITLCSMSICIVSEAETTTEEQQTYTISFNIDSESITDGNVSLFESYELEAGDYVEIPDAQLFMDSIYTSGWTLDGIYMYEPGDSFKMPEQDIVLEPVWVDPSSERYTLSYDTSGEDYTDVKDEYFPSTSYLPGQAISLSKYTITRDGYTHMGWLYNGYLFSTGDKLIMPAEDVVVEPNWYMYYKIYYEAGDVDRINGTSTFVYQRYETNTFDLANSSKISRSGFTLSGWLCDYDGEVYAPGSYFTMPASEVHFTAVWTPKTYTVVFSANNGTSQSIKISGETDTAITVPECTFTYSGYEFAGWKYGDTIYQPGEEFVIPGALPGLGISLTAVWVESGSDDDVVYDSFELVVARQQYANGEITADELTEVADRVIGR